jgi:predicted nucleotidyltransferase
VSEALQEPVARLAGELAGLPGAVAVALGGSRATGAHRPDSDWDLGLYYRSSFEPAELRRLGHEGQVSELGEWGPIVNGGAWLSVGGIPVDVLFRDLDTIERWIEQAEQGRFEILTQNGYLAGAPTYVPVGELALCKPIHGDLPRPEFSHALAEEATRRWTGRAQVSLMFAGMHAEGVASVGMLAHAVMCAAHARLADRREWVMNEKGLVERAGLESVQLRGVDAVSEALGIEPLRTR